MSELVGSVRHAMPPSSPSAAPSSTPPQHVDALERLASTVDDRAEVDGLRGAIELIAYAVEGSAVAVGQVELDGSRRRSTDRDPPAPLLGLVDDAGADRIRGPTRSTPELSTAAVGVRALELRGSPLAADRLCRDDAKVDVVARRQRHASALQSHVPRSGGFVDAPVLLQVGRGEHAVQILEPRPARSVGREGVNLHPAVPPFRPVMP